MIVDLGFILGFCFLPGCLESVMAVSCLFSWPMFTGNACCWRLGYWFSDRLSLWVSKKHLLKFGGWEKVMNGGREVRKGSSVGCRADGRGFGGDREGCYRCFAAEMGMRLWNWIWGNRKEDVI